VAIPEADTNRLYRNAALYLPLKLIAAAAGFATLTLLARALGPVDYGLYALGVAINIQIVLGFSGWLGQSVVFNLASGASRDVVLRVAMLMQLVLLILGCAASFVITGAFTDGAIKGYVTTLSFFSLASTFVAATQLAQKRVVFQGVLLSSIPLAQLLFTLSLYFLGALSLRQAILACAAGHCVALLIFALAHWQPRSPALDIVRARSEIRQHSKQLFQFGAGIGLWFFFWQLMLTGDRFVFRLFNLQAELGSYAAVRDLTTGIAAIVAAPLLAASHPVLLEWLGGPRADQEKATGVIRQNVFILIHVFVPLVVIFYVVGPSLASLVFGSQYIIGADTMALIATGAALSTIAMYAHKSLESKGRTLLMASVAVAVSATAILANVMLLPLVGELGAALTFCLAMLIYAGAVASLGGLLRAFSVAPIALIISGILCLISGGAAHLLTRSMESGRSSSAIAFAGIFAGVYFSLCLGGLPIAYKYRHGQVAK
jgi:O-antigen/teichoic acid export membrane protein